MTTGILQPVITEAGLAAIFRASNDGVAARITHIALGDSGYRPGQTQTRLRTERARYPVSDGKRLANNQLHLTAVADGDQAFWVREVAFLLEDGVVLAVWSDPDTPLAYKSPGVDLLLAYDLLLAALPADSVTVESSGAGLNLSLAGELAALATANLRAMLREVERDDAANAAARAAAATNRLLTDTRARLLTAEQDLQQIRRDSTTAIAANTTAILGLLRSQAQTMGVK